MWKKPYVMWNLSSDINHSLTKTQQPFQLGYHPELDITPYLTDDKSNQFQSFISVLHWIVEWGRLDIYVNTALLSIFLTQPRVGHMEALYYIFGYLKAHNHSTMVFDDSILQWRHDDFPTYDWVVFTQMLKKKFLLMYLLLKAPCAN